MPKTNVVFYQDEDGSVPILDWLDSKMNEYAKEEKSDV